MSLIKKIKDKKVNFEFNKEYIKVVTTKISNNDAQFITNSFKEMHPADAADIIEHLSQNDRENLIKLNNFNIDPEVFIELNESIQVEIIKYLSSDAIVTILKNLDSDDAIAILLVTTLMYSLLNSKFTFLSFIFFIKDINIPIIQHGTINA